MSNSQVKNLKDLVRIYGNQKTDTEIAQLLDIPIERISSLRRNLCGEIDTPQHSLGDHSSHLSNI